MINAQTLQQYFHADYRGAESILSEVLEPIFGRAERNNQSIIETNADRQKAQSTNIQEILNIATLDPEGSDECIKVFDVTIEDNCHIHIARKGIQHLIREWIDRFEGAFIVFHYANPKGRSWRLSYLEKRSKNSDSTSAKRYTYLCGQDYPCRTIAERFSKLSPDNINSTILEEAFSAEALSTEFFTEYKNFYDDFVNYVTKDEKMFARFLRYAKNDDELAKKSIRDYIKKLMGRLVFIQFLQKKAWLNNDLHYMLSLFNASTDKQKEDYLDNVLEPLFFGIFNTKKEDRPQLFKDNKWDKSLLDKWADFPYLNGGLFECDELDKLRLPIPSYFFSNPQNKDVIRKPTDEYYEDACGIFNFFERYNFTIDESDPLDKEVGVDPEMLGKIFENLLEDNKDKGAFYTPKEIVQYMCREALIAYLVGEVKQKSEGNEPTQANFEEDIRQFVTDPEMTVAQIAQYSDTQLLDLAESLEQVKICDPSIGSGAFPMGLLNLLVECREALNKALNINLPRYMLKKDIILNNIYGVDIERGAIDIARLRFWLSIVVDLEKPEALPNFDYKFMQGNSLLEQYKGFDLSNLTKSKMTKVGNALLSIFDDNTDVFRHQLSEYMKSYFTCSDHKEKADLYNKIRTNVENQIAEGGMSVNMGGIDICANDQFFLWHTWFKDVFDQGGFDIVIGNPPYGELRDLSADLQRATSLSKYHEYAKGGRVNLFQYFYPLGVDISCKGGIVSLIVQNSLLSEDTTIKNREFILGNSRIIHIDSFPERYDVKKRVFESVTMSVCICMLSHESAADYTIPIDIWKDKYKSEGTHLRINKSEIKSLYPESLIFPSCDEKSLKLLIKIKQKAGFVIHAQAGEVDMTKYNPMFTQNTADVRIITGSNVGQYKIATDGSFGKNFLLPMRYVNTISRANIRQVQRIVLQRITGVNAKYRFQGGLLSEPCLCANSTNYISASNNDIDLYYLLAVLNAHLLTYYDKLTNTNANITAKVLNNLPIPSFDKQNATCLKLVEISQMASNSNSFGTYESQIDELVYDLYGLSEDEKQIVRNA